MRWGRRQLLVATLAMGLVGCLKTRGPTQPSGAPAPAFEATSHRLELVSSADLVAAGPLVIVFYRGFW